MFTTQGTVIHFNNPKVQASLPANTFTVTGHAETKQLTEMLPGILSQLGADSLTSLRRLAETMPKPGTLDTTLHWTVSVILFALIIFLVPFFTFLVGDKAPLVAAEEEDDDVPGKCVTSVCWHFIIGWLHITCTWATQYVLSDGLESARALDSAVIPVEITLAML